jgi:hypothetical protein
MQKSSDVNQPLGTMGLAETLRWINAAYMKRSAERCQNLVASCRSLVIDSIVMPSELLRVVAKR